MPSQEEIEKLKHDWKDDPIWDLEDEEGFENHREELLAFRHQCEQQWAKEHKAKLERLAQDWGMPRNTKFAQRLLTLTDDLDRLQNRVTELETRLSQVEQAQSTNSRDLSRARNRIIDLERYR